MEEEKFDAVVVGAGPAGSAAAYTLAKAGLSVVLVERGPFPGSKNVMGAVLYRKMLDDIIPGFWKEAPLERCLIEENLWITTEDSVIKAGHRGYAFDHEPYNAFTIMRAKFDQWFAGKAEEAGAFLIADTTVEDVIRDSNGKIIGVRTGREEGDLHADVVIIAEGVWGQVAQKAGMARKPNPHDVAMAVKEIVALPREKIEDRFQLQGDQGATIEIVGDVTMGTMGMGFIYTNKETLSVGIGCLLSDLAKKKIHPNDLLEHMKSHPAIKSLLEGGEVVEYMAHLIPEGGYHAIPTLYTDGALLVGDAAMLVNAFHREGANLAMTSGRIAAETVIEAKKIGDFSANTLSLYRRKLEETFVIQDLKKYKNAARFLENNPQFFTIYPKLADAALHSFLEVDGIPKLEKQRLILQEVKKQRPLWKILLDLNSMAKAMQLPRFDLIRNLF